MSGKQSKEDPGLSSYKAWVKENKRLEKIGLFGTEYYIKKVEELEVKIKKLEEKLKRKVKR
jgi:hypothetical protein